LAAFVFAGFVLAVKMLVSKQRVTLVSEVRFLPYLLAGMLLALV
jgi:hypothetical protein